MNGKRLGTAVLMAAVLLFDLAIAWAVPYSATDDFLWGMEEGLHWWLDGTLNGRYAGNFLAVVLCRSVLAKTVFMGGVMFALPLAMAVLAAGDRKERIPALFALSHLGLLWMPAVVWQETYGWVSGFGNYVAPTLLFLCWLLLIRRLAAQSSPRMLWAVPVGLLSLCMGLFVENLALLFLLAALALAVWFARTPGLRFILLAAAAGALAAAAVIYSSGTVDELTETGTAINGLRELTFSLADGLPAAIWDIFSWYVGRLLPIAFLRGLHFAVPMAVITAMAFWHSSLRPLSVLGLIPLGCGLYIYITEEFLTPLLAALSLLSWCLPAVALLVRRGSFHTRLAQTALYLTAPLSLAPMAAVTTLGQRLYFFPMVIVFLAAAVQLAPLLERQVAARIVSLCLLAAMVVWGWRYWTVAGCTLLRAELIHQYTADSTEPLILPTDRYERVVWQTRNPWNQEYGVYYRRFYHIDPQITLVFLPAGSYETWPESRLTWQEDGSLLTPTDEFVPSLP